MTSQVLVRNLIPLLLLALPALGSAETITGRWKLLAAEDLRADGTAARLPWGAHPVGTIVVEGGFCYLQIMSADVPAFGAGATPFGEQMKATLLSSYIAYSGPCVVDESKGSVTPKVGAARRWSEWVRLPADTRGSIRRLRAPDPDRPRRGGAIEWRHAHRTDSARPPGTRRA